MGILTRIAQAFGDLRLLGIYAAFATVRKLPLCKGTTVGRLASPPAS